RRQEEFFRQIRLNPDDDNIRLIFADWLEEIGDERAEFIRVQCECARWEQTPDIEHRERYLQLKSHEVELSGLWRESCLNDLSSLGVKDVRFQRGFVERMHLEGDEFLPRTKNLIEWAPALRGVLWQKIPRQSASPIQRFLASSVCAALTTLNLMRNNLGASGVEALANSSCLENIQSLSLRENPIGGQGMQELMNSSYLSGLTRWDLTETQLSISDARALARSNTLHQLEELLVSHNQIGDTGLRALANTARLKTLKRLEVADNLIALEGIRALADSAHLTDLQVLDLSGNEIGDAGLVLMASASNYGRLTELNLAGCTIKPAGIANFAESPYLTRLTTLNLSHNPLRKGLPILLESRVAKNLKSLSLRHCDLDSQSIRLLLTEELSLEHLDLRDNPLINQY
ncbi:MAG: TIGR02996 domain-containing protein, partial [Planctomycetaceae bacterium]|nr:TIGR02996 domain-containing protein [Planctomycetaceae bacterium]